jgi:hypothetical protein
LSLSASTWPRRTARWPTSICSIRVAAIACFFRAFGKADARSCHSIGDLKSGKSGHKVKNRKQAVAIGLSEARKKGAKVPAKSK